MMTSNNYPQAIGSKVVKVNGVSTVSLIVDEVPELVQFFALSITCCCVLVYATQFHVRGVRSQFYVRGVLYPITSGVYSI